LGDWTDNTPTPMGRADTHATTRRLPYLRIPHMAAIASDISADDATSPVASYSSSIESVEIGLVASLQVDAVRSHSILSPGFNNRESPGIMSYIDAHGNLDDLLRESLPSIPLSSPINPVLVREERDSLLSDSGADGEGKGSSSRHVSEKMPGDADVGSLLDSTLDIPSSFEFNSYIRHVASGAPLAVITPTANAKTRLPIGRNRTGVSQSGGHTEHPDVGRWILNRCPWLGEQSPSHASRNSAVVASNLEQAEMKGKRVPVPRFL
jgi:hypothetical protein